MKDKLILTAPITFEDREISEVEYDFSELTGNDIVSAARQMGADVAPLLITSPEFQSLVFAAAAKQPIELIRSLKAPDFMELTARTLVFLGS